MTFLEKFFRGKPKGSSPSDIRKEGKPRSILTNNKEGELGQSASGISRDKTAEEDKTAKEWLEELDRIRGTSDLIDHLMFWSRAASRFTPYADYELGLCHRNGIGVKKNYIAALDSFRFAEKAGGDLLKRSQAQREAVLVEVQEAAESGDAHAQRCLGEVLIKRGLPTDYIQAVEWYGKASEQGDLEALYSLGFLYRDGKGGKSDIRRALECFRKAADLGRLDADTQAKNIALDLRNTAQRGGADQQYLLGLCYRDGIGLKKDVIEGLTWLTRASEFGHTEAQSEIRSTVEQLEATASEGDAVSQYSLGLLYRSGVGVTQDFGLAAGWFRKAGGQGHALAQNGLGAMYKKGTGVNQDLASATEWFQRAAEQGIPDAQNNLGLAYESGNGVTQDFHRAAEWYQKAFAGGESDARKNLERMYRNRQGVPANIFNMSPGEVVPISGGYYCAFCSAVNPALRSAVSYYAAEKGVSPTSIREVLASGAINHGNTPSKRFELGATFSPCPTCGKAAGWSLLNDTERV